MSLREKRNRKAQRKCGVRKRVEIGVVYPQAGECPGGSQPLDVSGRAEENSSELPEGSIPAYALISQFHPLKGPVVGHCDASGSWQTLYIQHIYSLFQTHCLSHAYQYPMYIVGTQIKIKQVNAFTGKCPTEGLILFVSSAG